MPIPNSAKPHRYSRNVYFRSVLTNAYEVESAISIWSGFRKHRRRTLHDNATISLLLRLLPSEKAEVIWRSDTRHLHVATETTFVHRPYYYNTCYICRHKVHIFQYVNDRGMGYIVLVRHMVITRTQAYRFSIEKLKARKKLSGNNGSKVKRRHMDRPENILEENA